MVKSSSTQHSSKKLVTTVESSHPGILHPVKSFVLKSNNTFAGRASDVFNRLSSLENEHSIWMANNETPRSLDVDDVPVESIPDSAETDTFKKPCSSTDTFKKPCTSTTDIFKKPYLPVRRSRKPGFIRKNKNTRVWRKYSLKDVPLTSDAKNAAVAFQFLNDLRKKKEEKCNETSSDEDKIIFRKPIKKSLVKSTSSSSNVSSTSNVSSASSSSNVSSTSSSNLPSTSSSNLPSKSSCNLPSTSSTNLPSSSKIMTEKLPRICCSIKLDHLRDEIEE